MKKNIAVFASGTGSNFLEIYNAIKKREIDANLVVFFSDKKNSLSIKKAREFGINNFTLSPKDFIDKKAFEESIIGVLEKANVDLIVLAGYMRILGNTMLQKYPKRIINIHPSLLPKYRGKDAIERQFADEETETGITIHYVNQGIDTGEIIFQKAIKITYPITLDELKQKIHSIEHTYYKQIINQVLEDIK